MIKIMLVNARCSTEAVRPKNQVQRLKNSCLSGIVVPEQNSMFGKVESGIANAAEILDFEATNLHKDLNMTRRLKQPPVDSSNVLILVEVDH